MQCQLSIDSRTWYCHFYRCDGVSHGTGRVVICHCYALCIVVHTLIAGVMMLRVKQETGRLLADMADILNLHCVDTAKQKSSVWPQKKHIFKGKDQKWNYCITVLIVMSTWWKYAKEHWYNIIPHWLPLHGLGPLRHFTKYLHRRKSHIQYRFGVNKWKLSLVFMSCFHHSGHNV